MVVAVKLYSGSKEGVTREKEFGEIGGKEGEASENIKHLFLPLC